MLRSLGFARRSLKFSDVAVKYRGTCKKCALSLLYSTGTVQAHSTPAQPHTAPLLALDLLLWRCRRRTRLARVSSCAISFAGQSSTVGALPSWTRRARAGRVAVKVDGAAAAIALKPENFSIALKRPHDVLDSNDAEVAAADAASDAEATASQKFKDGDSTAVRLRVLLEALRPLECREAAGSSSSDGGLAPYRGRNLRICASWFLGSSCRCDWTSLPRASAAA